LLYCAARQPNDVVVELEARHSESQERFTRASDSMSFILFWYIIFLNYVPFYISKSNKCL